ncbi:uncharacterized protein IL334_004296 [Kwoniella shivajii]|uniref:Uncharacterized protein n=1 Tax=Kwoniella shivajii TaxID=564305 RepID=A0ABZ1D2Y2_9TREE|nr:hypothetical protein IL334_004296 [Kwoniella shivajii]
MAKSTSSTFEDRRRDGVSDLILEKLSKTNTFDSDWPTLREHLHQSLTSALPLFLSRGPPRPYRPPESPIIGPVPITVDSLKPSTEEDEEGGKPPSESLLLSPSQSTSITTSDSASTPDNSTRATTGIGGEDGAGLRSTEVEPSATPSSGRLESLMTLDDFQPSTSGGLVIPPFPPLDRNRRRSDSTPGPSYSGGQIVSPRLNGMRGQRIVTIGPAVMDDEYDEETTIGGKILPAWMDQEEGQKELDRLVNILEDMDSPPFTLQRLSELLLDPTKHHTTFGKFLRAIEKSLLVTTSWTIPSYVPLPIPTFTSTPHSIGEISSSSGSGSVHAENGFDIESTMPPGSTTPMFSPIPFLSQTQNDDLSLGGIEGLTNGNASGQRSLDDGLMSPLMLNEDSMFGGPSSSSSSSSVNNPRSPTPEPEEAEPEPASNDMFQDADIEREDVEMTSTSSSNDSQSRSVDTSSDNQYESIEHSDPAHQSYLGRVDELDTGPISLSPPIHNTDTKGNTSPIKNKNGTHAHGHEDMQVPVPGTGEGGNMTPHGMSEKPVPISSTTVLKPDEDSTLASTSSRTIASLPRSASEKSLRDRFVSAGSDAVPGTQEDEIKGEDEIEE